MGLLQFLQSHEAAALGAVVETILLSTREQPGRAHRVGAPPLRVDQSFNGGLPHCSEVRRLDRCGALRGRAGENGKCGAA